MTLNRIRICLFFAFFLCTGCLGGPKVDPPEIIDQESGGAFANAGSEDEKTDIAGNNMDSGISRPTTTSSGGAGGRGGNADAYKESDAELTDDDDAGSVREP